MKKEGIQKWTDDVYTKLCALLSLYEETNHFTKVPEGEIDEDSQKFVNRKFKEIYDSINNFALYMDEDEISKLRVVEPGVFLFDRETGEIASRLSSIAAETRQFVNNGQTPIAFRWEMINRNLMHFDENFDLMEEYPEDYKELAWSKKRIFQEELLNTMKLLFEEEFREYL